MPRRAQWSREQVRDLALRQFGLITAAQLADIGVPRSTVEWHERQIGGMFSFLLPGVHRFEPSQAVAPMQYVAGAQLYGGPAAVITGAARLRRRGVKAAFHPAFGVDNAVHLLVPHGSKRGSRDFVVVERTRSLPAAQEDGLLRLAPIYRAAVDASRRCTDEEAVRALIFEVVQRRLASPESLNDERIKGQKRGSRFVRQALESVFAGARSVPEDDLRRLLDAAGLGRMLLNARVTTAEGVFIACPDAYDPDTGVVVEVDSREHHFGIESWEATMRRHARMTAIGLRVIHVSPRRLREEPEAVIAEVWAAIGAAAPHPSPDLVVERPA
jgi:very-short-patch-repair endonuclease